jgi:2-polyprenyl-6-hydroxyphenyl methylase/3-demethylubiquinone-9 3-methyltransferase
MAVSKENVDLEEIQKFSDAASRWWDKNGEFKPLHDINPKRLDWLSQKCHGLFGKNVLDVGCGGGILAESMAQQGAIVTAIDMSAEALEVAELHKLESNLKVNYVLSTAENFANQHIEHFDVVTCLEMLEHVPDPGSVIKACSDMTKPNGFVVFSTLNRNIKSYLMAILGAEYILNLVPRGTHDHTKFIKPSELLNMIDDTALVARATTGLHLDPLSQQYYTSNKNIDVNYMVCCQKQE